MSRLLKILALILSLNGNSQKPTTPVWTEPIIEFKTAKLSIQNLATKKFGPSVYNDASVLISNNYGGGIPKVRIEISNKFFLKEADFSIELYKKDEGLEYYSFSARDGNKYFSVTFYYNYYSDKPTQILIFGSEDIMATPQKRFSYLLTEFK